MLSRRKFMTCKTWTCVCVAFRVFNVHFGNSNFNGCDESASPNKCVPLGWILKTDRQAARAAVSTGAEPHPSPRLVNKAIGCFENRELFTDLLHSHVLSYRHIYVSEIQRYIGHCRRLSLYLWMLCPLSAAHPKPEVPLIPPYVTWRPQRPWMYSIT